METAEAIVGIAEAWLWIGAASAAVLLPVIGRFEPAARGAWVFRPLLIPGFVALWPLVWWRVLRGPGRWTARHAPPLGLQRALAPLLAAALVVALALGHAVRQTPPTAAPAVQVGP